MNLTNDMYVPSLRWRQGEYQALLRLAEAAKDRIVPFVMIPEIEFDFETWQPKKSVQEHVHPFALRFQKKWGMRPAWIGVHPSIIDKPMGDGRDIFTYVFEALRGFEAKAVPAVQLGCDLAVEQSVAAIVARDGQGMAITVRLEDLMKPQARTRVDALVAAVAVPADEVDLIIDLGAPNFEPYEAFAGGLVVAIRRLGDLSIFRNFVIVATAIPESFKDVAKGLEQLPRHDWLFYKALMQKLPQGVRLPNFGDYTIVHPSFAPIDMRKIKSSGKIVYTTEKTWCVSKGGAFRDNPEQMHDHCAAIIRAGVFDGETYSDGDAYIAACAIKKAKPSNLTRWKGVTINHHITRVLADLATLRAAS